MQERSLVYRISARGQDKAIKAIRSVLEETRRVASEEAKIADVAARATVAAARKSSGEKKKIVDDESAHIRRIMLANRQLEINNARALVNEQKKHEREKTKATEKESKERENAAIKAGDRIVRDMDRQAREHERAEKLKTKATEKEAKARSAAEQKEQLEIQRFVEKTSMATSRHVMAEREKQRRQAERDQRQYARDRAFEQRRLYKGLGMGGLDGLGLAYRNVTGLAMNGARSIYQASGLGDAFDIGGIVGQRAVVNQKLRSIAIESRGVGQEFNFDEKDAKERIKAAARATGISQTDLVQALDVFSEKGKGAEGVQNIERVAKESRAMGVAPAVVAKLRAQMMVSADATGQQLSEKDLQQAIAQMSFIGKTGVFRAGAMAEQSEALFSRAAASGIDFRVDLARYASFANEARKSTGSGATARTAINSIQDAMVKKEGKINALGVSTRDDEGHERNFIDIVEDLIVKTGGRGDAFNKIIDPSRSGKAIQTMLTAFHSAGGGEGGRAAMENLLKAGEGHVRGGSPQELLADFDKDIGASLNEESTQMKTAVENARQSIEEALEPALLKLAKVLPAVVDQFVMFVDFAQKHPWLAAAAVGGTLGGGSMISGAFSSAAGPAARFIMGSLVNTVPGLRGTGVGNAIAGGVGDAVASAGAQRVFVTNWPSGGFGGGGVPGDSPIDATKLVAGGGATTGGGGGLGTGALAGAAPMLGWMALAGVAGYGGAGAFNEALHNQGRVDTAWFRRTETKQDREDLMLAKDSKKRTMAGLRGDYDEATIKQRESIAGSVVDRNLAAGRSNAPESLRVGATPIYAPGGKLDPSNKVDAWAMKEFQKSLQETTKDLGILGNKAKSVSVTVSPLKLGPQL